MEIVKDDKWCYKLILKYVRRIKEKRQGQTLCQNQYNRIFDDIKRRQQLVELVIDKNYSIGRASHRLKLKLSTAKMIIKKYRDHGTFFEKKFLPKGKVET